MKTLFLKFLRSENMLSEFEFNYENHGFRTYSFESFLARTDPRHYISSAFYWDKTSRNKKNEDEGQRFWNDLTAKWYNCFNLPIKEPRLSNQITDRQKIKSAISSYFGTLNSGDVFYGSILASYCLEKAGCKNKYPSTVFAYMNQMKNKGLLNYRCVEKMTSKYIKL